ncbi:hypothetical protein HDU92_008418, partial [Lobulomyces angularis]
MQFYNIPYNNNENKKESLDLYIANKSDPNLIIFFHGGAWRSGDKSDFKFMGEIFLNFGYNICILTYNLSNKNGEGPYHPSHTLDCSKALHWLKFNSSLYLDNVEN